MKSSLKLIGTAAMTLLFALNLSAQNNQTIELVFVDHLTTGMIEQDVFVEKLEGSCEVYRVLPQEREKYLDAELFSTQEAQSHDPVSPEKAGPYRKGESLGMTLREWVSAKGSVSYVCEDGWGVVKGSFQNLRPNAVYTMWHAFMAKASAQQFTGSLDLPMGAPDGSQSIFTTDKDGNADFEVKFETCLQMTERQTAALLGIAFHSDGKTYGALAGPFGKATHIQLFTVLPEEKIPQSKAIKTKG